MKINKYKVKDIMNKDPISTTPDTTLEIAARIMHTFNIGSIIVIERGGYVIGIVTERDLMKAIALEKLPGETTLWEIMTRDPITIDPDKSITEALKIMMDNNIRHLPVVDRDKKLIGIISMRDIVYKALTNYINS